jgi:regulator of sigma E protease
VISDLGFWVSGFWVSFSQLLPAGCSQIFLYFSRMCRYSVRAAGAIVGALRDLITTGAGLDQTSGPVGIVTMIAEETQRSAEASWRDAVITYGELLVLISVNLGLFNLLPIPGLDGGHIVFTLFEIITGRKPSDRFMIGAQMIGMILLLGLMMLAFGNDIGRLIH